MNKDVLRAAYERHRTIALLAAIAGATLLAMALRRPDQWSAPAVWIEEGTVALPDYVANGWSSVLHPMMGYLVLPTKLILATAATLSFRWLPEIEKFLQQESGTMVAVGAAHLVGRNGIIEMLKTKGYSVEQK